MKKGLIAAVIIVVVIAGAVSYTLIHKASPSNSMSMSNSGASSSPQSTNKVSISNYSFSPASITIKKGATVIWTNHDSVAHTVVETDGKSGPNSQPIADGQSFNFTYNTVGTFAYHCSIHPEMTGKVTVTN